MEVKYCTHKVEVFRVHIGQPTTNILTQEVIQDGAYANVMMSQTPPS